MSRKSVFYVSLLDTASGSFHIRLFAREKDARACLTSLLAAYGIPYEVWRALHRILADEALMPVRQGLYFNMGEKFL